MHVGRGLEGGLSMQRACSDWLRIRLCLATFQVSLLEIRLERPANLTYSVAKHAVVGMTKQMAIDYAKDRIHVNCLCPGFVRSPMIEGLIEDPAANEALSAQHPWNAIGNPADIADAALFLASDEAAWVTGHSMVIDGGYTCQ